MFNSQKHVFWQALILAIFVFAAGILLGFMLENSRTNQIERLYSQTELDLLDVKIESDIVSSFDSLDCKSAIDENIKFADRIYEESKMLDRYEGANKLSESIILQHKKYDLMRTLFWVNSIKLRNRCNASYHNLVYLYDYNSPRLDIKAKQSVFSQLLGDIKADFGNEVMLIPLAGDNDVSSLKILLNMYNVSESELPVILVDEKFKITELQTRQQIESFLN